MLAVASAQEATPTIVTVPSAAQPSPNFSAEEATNAWMGEIPAASKARSDAYFEGGYWLILWDFLYLATVSLALLHFGWSANMRDLVERTTRFRWLQTIFYILLYILATTILTFPLTVYEGFLREHQYGLSTQTFGPWTGDHGLPHEVMLPNRRCHRCGLLRFVAYPICVLAGYSMAAPLNWGGWSRRVGQSRDGTRAPASVRAGMGLPKVATPSASMPAKDALNPGAWGRAPTIG
jgi:hypothetical protein